MNPIIRIEGVNKRYRTVGRYLGGGRTEVHAVRDVSLNIAAGQAFGLMGESGSGKSTLARMVMGLETPSGGFIEVDGTRLPARGRNNVSVLRKTIQIVFQDPYVALDPMMTIGASIEEPLINLTPMSAAERREAVLGALQDVDLPERMYDAHPFQLSGGERQRVCIARALVSRPRIVVCDEPVSSLDKSVQAQIIDLLRSLQRKYGLTYLFISHDLSVINRLCSEIAVMYRGCIVEQGSCEQVLFHPRHGYTGSLVEAARYFQEAIPRLSDSAQSS